MMLPGRSPRRCLPPRLDSSRATTLPECVARDLAWMIARGTRQEEARTHRFAAFRECHDDSTQQFEDEDYDRDRRDG